MLTSTQIQQVKALWKASVMVRLVWLHHRACATELQVCMHNVMTYNWWYIAKIHHHAILIKERSGAMTILHHSTYTNYHEQNLDEIMYYWKFWWNVENVKWTLQWHYFKLQPFDTRLSDFEIEVKKLRNQFSDFKTELNLNVTNFKVN